jgi:translation initiation factor 1
VSKRKTGGTGWRFEPAEPERGCPRCARPVARCTCAAPRRPAAASGPAVVRVGRETQGRKGKGVTVVTGVPLTDAALEELASRLKRLCGSGGTVRDDGAIEIQGDHRDRLVAELATHGWTVRRSGG